jgi:predicted NACHT family NTPase
MPLSQKHYDWRRYWVPREGSMGFDDRGFIAEPDYDQFGIASTPTHVPFEKIAHFPCLALLGEPGIGKTETLQHISSQSGTPITLRRDLSAYASDSMLHKAIFESSEFTNWINSTETLEIFLDSLDECLIHVRTVARLLVDEFAKYPRSRLRLRIACRTAEWPQLLSKELPRLWGEQNFAEYELAPLTRKNVRDAAMAEGVNPHDFLREIERLNIAALAMKPLTLIFLLQARGNFPETQTELYQKACLRLCSYQNANRLASQNPPFLGNEERLAIAERIAAVTMFGKRSAIFIGNDEAGAMLEDITISALAHGTEHISGHVVQVTPNVIREVIQTGLFTGRAGERMGWAHWTFAEFLAAQYVVRNKLSDGQITDLIMHPDTPDKVVPQLHETAAWLASMKSEFMNKIMSTDPQVLLASTIMSADAATREQLTAAILRRFDERGIAERDRNFSPRFDVLQHPNLAAQLRPILIDKGRNYAVRGVALDIVEQCHVTDLHDELVDVAVDRTEKWHMRHSAAFIISQFGSDEHKKKLLPLLNVTAEEDPEDELRGDALIALWPGHISVRDLFEQITKQRHGTVYGTYTSFLLSYLLKGLKHGDLPLALDWVAEHPGSPGFSEWHGLRGKIMRMGWENWDTPAVLVSFAKAAVSRIIRHVGFFNDDDQATDLIAAPREQRAAVIHAIINYASEQKIKLPRFWGADVRIIGEEDLPWLLTELGRARDEFAQRQFTALIRTVFDWRLPNHVDSILSAMENVTALRDEFGPFFAPVEIGSATAREMQEAERRRASLSRAPAGSQLAPISGRVAAELEKFEAGDIYAWWRLNVELVRGSAPSAHDEFIADLTSLPGWKELDQTLRDRCIAAAERYVAGADPHNERWLGTNTFYRPAAAGYRALRLLLLERPQVLNTLSADIWRKWSGIILGYPEQYGSGDIKPSQTLARLAYNKASDALTTILLLLIEKENQDHGSLFILKKIEQSWDRQLANTLREKLNTDETLKPQAFEQLLSTLMNHDPNNSTQLATSLLVSGVKGPDNELKRVKVAKVLLNFAAAQSWDTVWAAIQKDNAFGRRLFAELAHDEPLSQVPKLARTLPPDNVGQLFIWLEHEFPHTEDPNERGAHGISSRETIGYYRDALLTGLKERGSQAAVEALRNVARSLPQLTWLESVVADADRQRLRLTWNGVDPDSLYAMATSRRPRFVESADQLLERIIELMQRLQSRLHGDTPAIPDLWDKDQPKDENHLSNYIKRYLSDDLAHQGIISNREVQIRRGEFSDVRVDAVRRVTRNDPLDVVTVIVEAKGCWNKGVKNDMADQLRDRYLKENQCRHGLYVVGWFLCPKWTNQDYRRAQTPKWTLDEARHFFSEQAANLSTDGLILKAFVMDLGLR